MKKKLTILVVFALTFLSFTITTKAVADDGTKVEVYAITDENLTAYFNGTSTDGSVNYYIEGIEVLTEFQHINNLITALELLEKHNTNVLSADMQGVYDELILELSNLRDALLDQINIVSGNVLSNLALIQQNNKSIENVKDNLLVLNNHLYMLKDELISFEEVYLENISRINTMLDQINEKLSLHKSLIQENQQNISELQQKYDDLTSNIANVGGVGSLILLSIGLLYIINKKHPLSKILDSDFIHKNGKQYRLFQFTKNTKKQKSKTLRYRIKQLKLDKSPLKFLFSFFNVNK